MLIYVNYSLNWQEKQRDQYAQQLFGRVMYIPIDHFVKLQFLVPGCQYLSKPTEQIYEFTCYIHDI